MYSTSLSPIMLVSAYSMHVRNLDALPPSRPSAKLEKLSRLVQRLSSQVPSSDPS
jgi:hypothetical protein